MRPLLTSLVCAAALGLLMLVLGLFLQSSVGEHADTRLFSLALAVLVAMFAGAGVGMWIARQNRLYEDALEELERAAERVASGDLTSALGSLQGERADQTFRTFDKMTRELREMRTRLLQTERETAFRDVAQRIAHEIRNPLSPIRVAIETLRKARERKLPEFDEIFEESTRTVLDEVTRLSRIVHDFSEFARLPKPRPGTVDLGALVQDALTLYRPPNVETTFTVDDGAVSVHADREQIMQVVVNLLNNARDAVVDANEPKIRLSLCPLNDAMALYVDDNGQGVAEADRARIFEPYVTTKEHGTGLGLAIAERIAREHGGSLSVTTSPLGGARFSLVLPREGVGT